MKIISFINYKGGVGKTTLASNIAAELAHRGKMVLGIDLDPQTNFTFSFFKVDEWKHNFQNDRTIKNWYDDFINNRVISDISNIIVKPTKVNELTYNNLDIICSHLGLINVELDLAIMLSAITTRQQRKNYQKVYSLLGNGLKMLKDRYDVIIIDCPPNFNIVTKNALIASDYYVFPAKPDYLSTLGIEELKRHITQLVNEYNNNTELLNDKDFKKIYPMPLGMIANMIGVRNGQPIAKQEHYISEVRNKGIHVFNSMIRDSKTIYADAPEDCMPVVLNNFSDDTFRKVKSELESLTSEFIERVGL
jgi:chromosome partitioning protein